MLVDVTRVHVDQPVSTVPETDSDDADVAGASWLDRPVELESGLSRRGEVVASVNCCDIVVGGPVSASLSGADRGVDFAGCVAVSVAFPAVLVTIGVASLADVEVASSAYLAGGVTIGVTSPAIAGVASPAVAGVASLAEAGGCPWPTLWGVTVGMTSLADAGAASLADAGVASLADLAGGVTVEATFPDVGGATSPAVAGVTSLADAGAE